MQPRLAKKIVQRVQSGDVNRTSYRQDQVEAAFRVMGQTLTPEHLKPWTEARVTEDPADVAARAAANQQRRAENLKRLEERRQARVVRVTAAKIAAQSKRDFLQSLIQTKPEPKPEPEEAPEEVFETEPVSAQEVAVAAAREVFQQTMAKGSVPESVTIEPVTVTDHTPDYNSLTVAELRALVKKTGLKGYSSMTKPELLAVLTIS